MSSSMYSPEKLRGISRELRTLSRRLDTEISKSDTTNKELERSKREAKQQRSLKLEYKQEAEQCKHQLDLANQELADLRRACQEAEDRAERVERNARKRVVALSFDNARLRKRGERSTDPSKLFEWNRHVFSKSPQYGLFVDAARNGYLSVIKKCLEPDFCEDNPFDFCEEFKEADYHTLLAEALFEAIKSSTEESADERGQIIELLLAEGAEKEVANFRDSNGRTILHVAAIKDKSKLLKRILRCSGLINGLDSVDSKGFTPLQLAAKFKKYEAAKVLMENGADFETKNGSGVSAEDLLRMPSSSFSLSLKGNEMEKLLDDHAVLFWNYSQRGLQASKEEYFIDAYEYFTKSIESFQKQSALGLQNIARVHYNRASTASKIGRIETSVADLEKATTVNPLYIKAFELLASGYERLFMFDKAVEAYDCLINVHEEGSLSEILSRDMQLKLDKYRAKRKNANKHATATHYHILNLGYGASSGEIKKAFRKESIRWHPDKHMVSESDRKRAVLHFQRISDAKTVLLDKEEKYQYDLTLKRKSWGMDVFSWTGDIFENFSSIYKDRLAKEKAMKDILRKTTASEESVSDNSTENVEPNVEVKQEVKSECAVLPKSDEVDAEVFFNDLRVEENTEAEDETSEKSGDMKSDWEMFANISEDSGSEKQGKKREFNMNVENDEDKVDDFSEESSSDSLTEEEEEVSPPVQFTSGTADWEETMNEYDRLAKELDGEIEELSRVTDNGSVGENGDVDDVFGNSLFPTPQGEKEEDMKIDLDIDPTTFKLNFDLSFKNDDEAKGEKVNGENILDPRTEVYFTPRAPASSPRSNAKRRHRKSPVETFNFS